MAVQHLNIPLTRLWLRLRLSSSGCVSLNRLIEKNTNCCHFLFLDIFCWWARTKIWYVCKDKLEPFLCNRHRTIVIDDVVDVIYCVHFEFISVAWVAILCFLIDVFSSIEINTTRLFFISSVVILSIVTKICYVKIYYIENLSSSQSWNRPYFDSFSRQLCFVFFPFFLISSVHRVK